MMIWFSEPTREDPNWRRNDQTYFDWVSTSTLPRAKAARDFLNYNISCLPRDAQPKLYLMLKSQWQSTFFEIVVGRTLQGLGAKVTYEQEILSGRTPDYHAEFKDQTIVVEAVSPQINQKEIKQQAISVERLEGFIQENTPQGYSVSIQTLPGLTGSAPLGLHKAILTKLLNQEIQHESAIQVLSKETDLGLFELTLIRREPGWPVIIARFGATYFCKAVMTIQEVLKKKKKQVQGSNHLRILAIHGDSQCTKFEVDQALFGQKVEHACGKVEFIADGKFSASNSFDGVLFFEQIGFSCPNEPILYKHPQSIRPSPQELEIVRQRTLVNRKEIKELESKNRDIMAVLMPLNLSHL